MVDVIEVHRWPSDDSIAQLVIVDHQRRPRPSEVRQWVAAARADDPVAIRTGALFPDAADAFAAEGFQVIDTLSLLRRELSGSDLRTPLRAARHLGRERGVRLTTMRRRHLEAAAALDREAFGDEWGHRAASLGRIAAATARARQRMAVRDRRPAGFAITGFGGRKGYLQRLSVDPADQRSGIGRLLVIDALEWLQRCGARSAMVNTGVDNAPALTLYRSLGFRAIPDRLRVMELLLDG
ncbi:MAG: GNAT family N-acetyltransferase [Acidimicrobiia bacterium]|nr:GNAT family N-acetyltransferase [Acidimicrobiia bacterium]MBA3984966.1 GNAT family N-acetyltransferase [Acidimicrobiia bacterium]MDQ3390888.1 GNAT family N-acetyltransferase [Actinomycetota bacterium]